MQKFLKKITKYLFHGFLGLFVLILLIYLMIQTPFVKNWTRNYINKQVSKNIAGDFNIAKLRGDLFTKIMKNFSRLRCLMRILAALQ